MADGTRSTTRRWLAGGTVLIAACAVFAAVGPVGADQPPLEPQPEPGSVDLTPFDPTVTLGTQPEPGSIDDTPFDPTVTLGTQPPNPDPQPESFVETTLATSAEDLGDPTLGPTVDLGDPTANGADEPPEG